MRNFFLEDNLYNRAMTKVFDLCLLNLLTFIYCIPIVTAGAAFTAMDAVMLKMIKNQEGPIIKSYVKEFKANWKGSVKGWLLLLIVLLVLLFDLSLWTQTNVENRSLFWGLTIAMMLALCAVMDWYFAVRAKFVETSKTGLINAAKFAMVYLPASIVMGAYTLAMVWLVTKNPTFIAFVPIFGISLLTYPKVVFIGGKFDAYIEQKGGEVAPDSGDEWSLEASEQEKAKETETDEEQAEQHEEKTELSAENVEKTEKPADKVSSEEQENMSKPDEEQAEVVEKKSNNESKGKKKKKKSQKNKK